MLFNLLNSRLLSAKAIFDVMYNDRTPGKKNITLTKFTVRCKHCSCRRIVYLGQWKELEGIFCLCGNKFEPVTEKFNHRLKRVLFRNSRHEWFYPVGDKLARL